MGGAPGSSPLALRVRLLGPLAVSGELTAPVPPGKAGRVLAVLAQRRGEFVPVASIVEALWDADPPERADRNVAALVSRLRRALGRDRIEGGAASYRLVTAGVSVDLHEAVDLLAAGEQELGHGRWALASTSAEQAVKLLEADLALAGERADPWVLDLRRSVVRSLHRARICWAGAALQLRAHDTAVEVGSAVLRDDPLDEQATRVVMLAHQRAGRSAAALSTYQELRAALADQLGTVPSPATQSVFLGVLRAQSPTAARRQAGTERRSGDLVGRDVELAALRRLWDGAVGGTPALAVVAGEAGIGRSALVAAFAEEPDRTGALVLTVGCFEAERSLYLQPLVEAVRAVVHRMDPAQVRDLAGPRVGTLVALAPELAAVLGPAALERAGPELEHRRSLDALAGFLVRLSAHRPVLLVIEDAHHAGQSTVEALHVLAGQWSGSRIMIVVTERRTEDDPGTAALRDVAHWFDLGPLSAADVATLVARAGRADETGRLFAWTGGSPLFLTELLRHSTPATGRGGVPVPPSLTGAVAERLAHVGERAARVLSHGAVLGSAFTLDEVARLSGLGVEECARWAAAALRAGLLTEHGESFRFANDVVRQVAYDSVPAPVRVSRHRRAARILEARPEAAAHHLAAARDWDGAARAWADAAHAAHLAFAGVEAEQLLGQAVEAARTAGLAVRLAEVLLRRGQARSDLGRHDAARADHEEALAIAREEGDTELEARVLEQLGWTAFYARDALVAVDFAERASELAESAAAAPGALPSATLLLGRVRHWDGDYAGAGAAYERVLGGGDPGDTTTALALAYRGALLQHQDRFAEAKAVLARAAVLCRRTGQFRPLLQTLFFTGLARGDCGDFAGALRALDNARRLIDADGVSFYRAGIETTTSWMWQELGQVARAREHAELAVELAHRGGGALELEQELHALLAVADCDLLLGRADDAAAAVEAAAPMLERSLPFKPRAAMRLREMRSRWDRDQAEGLLTEARTYSSAKYAALALRRLGRPEQAAALAAGTGSDLLVAQLGAPPERAAAAARIAASLPVELRTSFVTRGRLCVPPPWTH